MAGTGRGTICKMCFLPAIAILGMLVRTAIAADYHVDSHSGADGNDGLSPQRAWKSLERVNRETFRPGDRILFRAGSRYTGQLRPTGSGALVDGKPMPITIDSYGKGKKPRIDGKGVAPATFLLRNVEYWEVRNLEITNKGKDPEPTRTGVSVHIEDFGTAHHIILNGLYIHDINGSHRKKDGGGAGINWHNGGSRIKSRFDGLTIENCHIQRCVRNGITNGGYWQRDVWHPNLNVVIRGNLIEEVPGDGIVPVACDGALVERNVMRDSPRLPDDGGGAAGIWPWSSDNTVIQFNEVSGHKAPWDGQGFDSDWNCRNSVIQYNYSHDNEGGFVLICNPGDTVMPMNIGNIGTVVRYNISVNDGLRATGKHAGFSPAFHVSGPVQKTRIYNNLICAPRKRSPKIERTLLRMDNWGSVRWPEDTLFANNIFLSADGFKLVFGSDQGTIFTHNCYAGVRENAPPDPQAVLKDPAFFGWKAPLRAPADPARVFRLSADSPCRRAGTRITDDGGRDFAGTVLPADGPVSIGPLEFTAKE